MPGNYWLVKQEPDSYSYAVLVKEGGTAWTGIRNYQARNSLRSMKSGDLVLFYHSGEARAIVGVAEVSRGPYADPTAKEGDWVAVDLKPVKPLARPIPLAEIKADAVLREMLLLRQTRLSVTPVSATQFGRVLKLSGTS